MNAARKSSAKIESETIGQQIGNVKIKLYNHNLIGILVEAHYIMTSILI